MAQVFLPDTIPPIVRGSNTTITLATSHFGSQTRILIGGQQYVPPSAGITLSTASSGLNGLDTGGVAASSLYYVYAVVTSSGVLGLVASLSAAGPAVNAGYVGNLNNGGYKLVGQFDTNSSAVTTNTMGVSSSSTPQFMPSGVMMDFAGTVSPSGWLFCNGATVSRTTYGALFAAISTAYGVGDGSSTFALPDFRGRFARYNDDMGGSVGAAGLDTGRVHGSTQTQTTAKNGLSNSPSTLYYQNGTYNGQVVAANAGASNYGTCPNNPFLGSGFGQGSESGGSCNIRVLLTANAQQIGGDSETRPINLSCNKIIKV